MAKTSPKLKREIFRYIEFELYQYEENKKMIEQIRDDILYQYGQPYARDGVKTQRAAPGDPTGQAALKLITTSALAHAERTARAIEEALARLTGQHRAIFEKQYQEKKPWRKICTELNICESGYFKKRRELVFMVGVQMGLIIHA